MKLATKPFLFTGLAAAIGIPIIGLAVFYIIEWGVAPHHAGIFVALLVLFLCMAIAYLFNRALRFARQMLEKLAQTNKALLLEISERKESGDFDRQKKELQEMSKRLGELSRLKDEFIAMVNHELRTPLTSIKEGVSLLSDGVLGPINGQQQDYLKIVSRNVDRLTELISNLLNFSKIEAGLLQVVRRRTEVRELIQTAVDSYRPLAGSRLLKVEWAEVPAVFADPNRTLQVLGNLISNAVKFTPKEGAITLSVRGEGGHVAISVRDNGAGIASDDLPKLFQKFSQVGQGKSRPGGTGLGLALCKELVTLQKGEIWVQSELGRGSVFTFTLPVYTHDLASSKTPPKMIGVARKMA